MLPAEYTAPNWRGNKALEVVFNEYAGYEIAGPLTDLQFGSDIVSQNEIIIIDIQRKMNKQEMIRASGREINWFGNAAK